MTKLALIQTNMTDSLESNLTVFVALIREAAKAGAEVICLPELFHSKYFCISQKDSNFALAYDPSPMAELARELGVVLVVPYFEKRAPGVFHNSAVIYDTDGTQAGHYRKMHIPDDPGFNEKFYFTPGDQGYQVVKTKFLNIGILICWDQWFPEAARLTAMKGADILLYPTAIGSLPGEDSAPQINAWKTIQTSHAIANGVFVAAINRVGTEEDTCFFGNSFAVDPFGQPLAEAGTESETLFFDIETDLIGKTRQTWPFLRDRRIDSYGGLLKRYLDEN